CSWLRALSWCSRASTESTYNAAGESRLLILWASWPDERLSACNCSPSGAWASAGSSAFMCCRLSCPGSVRTRARDRWLGRQRVPWKDHGELRAFTQPPPGFDRTAVPLDDPAHIGQAHAFTHKILRGVQAAKWLEELIGMRRVEAGTIVDHRNFMAAARPQHGPHVDACLCLRCRVFDGIAQQVHEGLVQQAGMAVNRRQRPDPPLDVA